LNILDLSEKDRKEMIKLIKENKIFASTKDGLYLTGYLEYDDGWTHESL
jgi:hypothetical protein